MLLFLAILLTTQIHAADDVAPDASTSTPNIEEVQKCLDEKRAQRFKERQEVRSTKGEFRDTFTIVNPNDLPSDCPEGDLKAFKSAIKEQIKNCKRPSPSVVPEIYKFGCREFTRTEWCLKTNNQLLKLANKAKDFSSLLSAMKSSFTLFKNIGFIKDSDDGSFKKGDFQFTGYYVPEPIDAYTKPTGRYVHPIYKVPTGTVTLKAPDNCGTERVTGETIVTCRWNKKEKKYEPLPTRREIDEDKKLKGQKLEIAYVRDPLDIAFLMTQGSGALKLLDKKKKVVRLNYAGKNGHPNHMLGRILGCTGVPLEARKSASEVRAKFAAMPEKYRRELMMLDSSYVFFRSDNKGPFGTDGIKITPRHSFATDVRLIPTGSVLLINTLRPGGPKGHCTSVTTAGISQDTGGLILDEHADWYQGADAEGKKRADAMNFPGSLYLAVPKDTGKVLDCNPVSVK